MKKYDGNDYGLTINRARMDDKGEYTVRAKNSYGSREEVVLLNVTKITGDYEPKPLEPMRKAPELPKVEEYEEERSAPKFTFHLRPRLIQKNHQCKLICSLQGNPPPKVVWLKDGSPVDTDRVQVTFRSGVVSLEIFNARIDDAGMYSCRATNELGEDYTECMLTVQTKGGEPIPALPRATRRIYDSLHAGDTIEKSRSYSDVRRRGSSLLRDVSPDTHSAKDDLKMKVSNEPPNFTSKLQNIDADEGEDAEFSCGVGATPEPIIEWLHNGETIADSRYSAQYTAGTARLKISGLKADDAGEFICRASNSAGRETSKASLNVKSKKANGVLVHGTEESVSFESHPAGQIVESGSPLTLEASVSGEPSHVQWLHNGVEVTQGTEQSGGRLSLTVDAADASHAGQYQLIVNGGITTAVSVVVLGMFLSI